jgi:hypothetical protein
LKKLNLTKGSTMMRLLCLAVLLVPGMLSASQPPKKGGKAVASPSSKNKAQKPKEKESSQSIRRHPAFKAITSHDLAQLRSVWQADFVAYRDQDGLSLLQLAAHLAHSRPSEAEIEIIRFLLQSGIDPDQHDTKRNPSARERVERKQNPELLALFSQYPARPAPAITVAAPSPAIPDIPVGEPSPVAPHVPVEAQSPAAPDVPKNPTGANDSIAQTSNSFITMKNVLLSAGVISVISAIAYWARSQKVVEQPKKPSTQENLNKKVGVTILRP